MNETKRDDSKSLLSVAMRNTRCLSKVFDSFTCLAGAYRGTAVTHVLEDARLPYLGGERCSGHEELAEPAGQRS